MRIIFINRYFHPDHSATSQMLTGIARGLACEGHDVRVVTSRQRYDTLADRLAPREMVDGIHVTRVWTSRFGRTSLPGRAVDYATFYLTSALAVWRAARAGDIVVAKTDPPLLSVVIGPVAGWRRAHLVNWLQDIYPEVAEGLGMARGRLGGMAIGLLKRLRNRSLRKATLNVVLGERMAQRAIALGAPSGNVRTIPNWADGDLVRPVARETNSLRREWGLEGAFVVGYSGNLGRAHDIATMIQAIEDTEGGHAPDGMLLPIKWLFIGGGAQLERLRAEVERRALKSVVFKPYQPSERLAESLSAADVHLISLRPAMEGLIVPSKYYGIAAAGRPGIFIGDADGEIARILTSTGTGAVVRENDGQGLAAVIRAMARDPDAADQMGARARRLHDERYDLMRAVRAWSDALSAIDMSRETGARAVAARTL